MTCETKRSRWLLVVERVARFGGFATLSFCALLHAAGELGRRADVGTLATNVDSKLWSPARLREYEESLNIAVEPPVALLQVDALGILVPVYSDTREVFLNRGAGLIDGMALPGHGGNLGVAGHRDGYFRPLKDLKLGDVIIVRTHKHRFEFTVTSIDIVPKEDTSFLTDTADPTVTLVTCYPFYFVGQAPSRFVARARLDRTYSDNSWLRHSTGDDPT
jgi:LPXTG-site transpeptidase (sortase) family protein